MIYEINANSFYGKGGQWLLDPFDITIGIR